MCSSVFLFLRWPSADQERNLLDFSKDSPSTSQLAFHPSSRGVSAGKGRSLKSNGLMMMGEWGSGRWKGSLCVAVVWEVLTQWVSFTWRGHEAGEALLPGDRPVLWGWEQRTVPDFNNVLRSLWPQCKPPLNAPWHSNGCRHSHLKHSLPGAGTSHTVGTSHSSPPFLRGHTQFDLFLSDGLFCLSSTALLLDFKICLSKKTSAYLS